MEEEILDKFEIIGTIRITKGQIIRLSFTFIYTYFKDVTIDVNIFYMCKEIDKHIIKLFKEE